MKAVKADDRKTNKKLYSRVTEPNDYVSKNSRTVFQSHPASIGFVSDHYLERATVRSQGQIASSRWINRNREHTFDPAEKGISSFSELDKKVLKSLLYSDGKLSSLGLSRKLEIPCTTIQRKRKRLEGEFLEKSCSLRLDRLGWRIADILVSTHKGMNAIVGKELLDLSSVTRVHRTIGEHTIDLHAEVVFRDNKELLNIIEWIKSLDGIRDVVWTESVEMVGKNTSIQYEIIDNHS